MFKYVCLYENMSKYFFQIYDNYVHEVAFCRLEQVPKNQLFHKLLLNLENIYARVVQVCNDAQVEVKNIFVHKRLI